MRRHGAPLFRVGALGASEPQSSEILGIGDRLHKQYGVTPEFLDDAMKGFIVQTEGKDVLEKQWGIQSPQYLISATKHYSWPKAAGERSFLRQRAFARVLSYV